MMTRIIIPIVKRTVTMDNILNLHLSLIKLSCANDSCTGVNVISCTTSSLIPILFPSLNQVCGKLLAGSLFGNSRPACICGTLWASL